MMSQFATRFDALIQEAIAVIMQQGDVDEGVQYIASETLGEVIEKLIILHVRCWNLEDEVGAATDAGDAEHLAAQHVKLDEINKIVRPRLMAALTKLLVEAVIRNRTDLLGSGNLKQYRTFEL